MNSLKVPYKKKVSRRKKSNFYFRASIQVYILMNICGQTARLSALRWSIHHRKIIKTLKHLTLSIQWKGQGKCTNCPRQNKTLELLLLAAEPCIAWNTEGFFFSLQRCVMLFGIYRARWNWQKWCKKGTEA